MPVYEYICRDCHWKFDEVLSVKEHDTKQIQCPKCHSKNVEKVIELFHPVTAKKS